MALRGLGVSNFPHFGLDADQRIQTHQDRSIEAQRDAYAQPAVLPKDHTVNPIVTGTSVLAMRYKDGIVMLADTLGSYGSLARFKNVRRVRHVGPHSVIGASGEYSDFQFLMKELDDLLIDDRMLDDGSNKQPAELFSYITRVMYHKRSRFDPYYNQLILAGIGEDGKPFLGQVDMLGSNYEDETLATGFGAHIARPLLRKAHEANPNMTFDEAKKVLDDAMRVLIYRDCRTINKIQCAKISAAEIVVSEPYALDTYWLHGEKQTPVRGDDGTPIVVA
eukprot:TRINITY_DN2626_c5_g1_i1.p1 TRINITY_DN2626_c5_g1~~TRINITY_DN2626_c5_g1_i1.p1  ORF type:complete len:293 (-),score=70.40 TRINITY_DN2626_c5_g1_i1:87-920(-)